MEDQIKKVLYHAKKDGNGSALELSTFRGKGKDGTTAGGDLVIMLAVAAQTGTNTQGNATFGWKDSKKSISLTVEEAAELSLLLRQKASGIRLYHDGSKRQGGGSIVQLLGELKDVDQKNKEGQVVGKVKCVDLTILKDKASTGFRLIPREAYLMAVLLDHIIPMACVSTFVYQSSEGKPAEQAEGSFATAGAVGGGNDTFDPLE